MIDDAGINKQIARLMQIPFAPGAKSSPEQAKARAAEFKRVLLGGCKSDSAVRQVVDMAVDQCEECPAPATIVEIIRQVNANTTAQEEVRIDREKEWRKKYGPPQPISLAPDCCMCGKPWKEILAEGRAFNARVDEIAKALVATNRVQWQEEPGPRLVASRELAKQGIVPHSVSCPAVGSRSVL